MGYCESYWTNTGSMDEVKHHLKYNILEIRDDVIKMLDGESVRIIIKEEFRAGQKAPSTKKEISVSYTHLDVYKRQLLIM